MKNDQGFLKPKLLVSWLLQHLIFNCVARFPISTSEGVSGAEPIFGEEVEDIFDLDGFISWTQRSRPHSGDTGLDSSGSLHEVDSISRDRLPTMYLGDHGQADRAKSQIDGSTSEEIVGQQRTRYSSNLGRHSLEWDSRPEQISKRTRLNSQSSEQEEWQTWLLSDPELESSRTEEQSEQDQEVSSFLPYDILLRRSDQEGRPLRNPNQEPSSESWSDSRSTAFATVISGEPTLSHATNTLQALAHQSVTPSWRDQKNQEAGASRPVQTSSFPLEGAVDSDISALGAKRGAQARSFESRHTSMSQKSPQVNRGVTMRVEAREPGPEASRLPESMNQIKQLQTSEVGLWADHSSIAVSAVTGESTSSGASQGQKVSSFKLRSPISRVKNPLIPKGIKRTPADGGPRLVAPEPMGSSWFGQDLHTSIGPEAEEFRTAVGKHLQLLRNGIHRFGDGKILQQANMKDNVGTRSQNPKIGHIEENLTTSIDSDSNLHLEKDINILFSYLTIPGQQVTDHITEQWMKGALRGRPAPRLGFDGRLLEFEDPRMILVYKHFVKEAFMLSDTSQFPNLAYFCKNVKEIVLRDGKLKRKSSPMDGARKSPSETQIVPSNQEMRLRDSYFMLLGYSHGLRPSWMRFLRSFESAQQEHLTRALQSIIAKERLERLGLLADIRAFFQHLADRNQFSPVRGQIWNQYSKAEAATILFLYNLMILHQTREIFDGIPTPLDKKSLLLQWKDLMSFWEACYLPIQSKSLFGESESKTTLIQLDVTKSIQEIRRLDLAEVKKKNRSSVRVNRRHKVLLAKWLHRLTPGASEKRISELPDKKLDGLEVFLSDCSWIEFMQSST